MTTKRSRPRRGAPEEYHDAGPLFGDLDTAARKAAGERKPEPLFRAAEAERAVTSAWPDGLNLRPAGVSVGSHDEDRAAAEARRAEGMGRAIGHAEKVAPGWEESALAAIRRHAERNERFLAEDVPLSIPDGVDPRAVGPLFARAARAGLIVSDGFAPANSSNRSPKVQWKSRIYRGAASG